MAQDDWDLLDIDEALQEIEKAQLKHLQGIKEEMQEFMVNHLFEKDLRDIDEGWKKFEEASRKNVRFRSMIQTIMLSEKLPNGVAIKQCGLARGIGCMALYPT